MNYFSKLIELVGRFPDAVALLACPALLLLAAILLALLGGRRLYPGLALFLGGLGGFFVYAKNPSLCASYLLLFTAFSALCSLLLLIPRVRRRTKDEAGELYEKFALPLEVPPEPEDGERTVEPSEGGEPRLEQAKKLLEELKKSALSASDRLEADALSSALDGYSDRELTADETRALNDCLATILKLTAKYKL